MALNPDYYDATSLMAFYLEPRWYGSEQAALSFARSCVTSQKWGGRVPLTLFNTHSSLAAYLKKKEDPAYWQQPGVWKDVQASFEKFFQLNPTQTGWRHDYAECAYLCGQYQVFLEQTKHFTRTNFPWWGGEAQFSQMLATAKAQAR